MIDNHNGTEMQEIKEPPEQKVEACAFENCGICKQPVVLGEAKLLGCLHTFCTECIEKSEKERQTADNVSNKVLCPVSRFELLVSVNFCFRFFK